MIILHRLKFRLILFLFKMNRTRVIVVLEKYFFWRWQVTVHFTDEWRSRVGKIVKYAQHVNKSMVTLWDCSVLSKWTSSHGATLRDYLLERVCGLVQDIVLFIAVCADSESVWAVRFTTWFYALCRKIHSKRQWYRSS